jgi:hypothetical protein
MKLRVKLTALFVALALAALAIGSCATGGEAASAPVTTPLVAPPAHGGGADFGFSVAMDRDWILSEIRTATGTVALDRALHAETFGDIFTLRFENGMAFGMGMPNTFRGPYALGENMAISFSPMATTLMAAFMEPEEITEHEFLQYLDRAARWSVSGGILELFTTDENGAAAVLVFVLL